jgi:hypothetical protein
LLLKREVPPKTGSAKLCCKLFATGHCCENFNLGCATLSQSLCGVRMKGHFLYVADAGVFFELAEEAPRSVIYELA